jgi:hypothetical protein
MRNILGKRSLITGPVSSFASAISISGLAAAAEDNGAVVAIVIDEMSGVSLLQQFGLFEKITGHHNPKLSLEVIAPALTLQDQLARLKAVDPHDGTLIVARYFDRNLQPLSDSDLWNDWQTVIAGNLHCRTLTVAHWGSMPTPAPLSHKHWDRVWVIRDGFVQTSPARSRVNEPRDLVQTKGGDRTVHLLGLSSPGTIIFSEIKPGLVK